MGTFEQFKITKRLANRYKTLEKKKQNNIWASFKIKPKNN